jgi:hypothetical protein
MSRTKEKYYSEPIVCNHCNNFSKMEVIGAVCEKIGEFGDPDMGPMVEENMFYEVLKCPHPNCLKVNIRSYYWNDIMDMEGEDNVVCEYLYPGKKKSPLGMPDNILKAYEAAEKVKSIDVSAYVILLRKVLELTCIDRHAAKGNLAPMLKDLAIKGEIPVKLVNVAEGLKNFGNIGAHASNFELSEEEIPIVEALSRAILEYVYSAPHLAAIAESRLNKLKSPKL